MSCTQLVARRYYYYLNIMVPVVCTQYAVVCAGTRLAPVAAAHYQFGGNISVANARRPTYATPETQSYTVSPTAYCGAWVNNNIITSLMVSTTGPVRGSYELLY